MPAKPTRPNPAGRQPGRPEGSRRSAQSHPPRPRRAHSDPARRVALDVLRAVSDRDAYANLLLPSLLTERGIAGRDAAFATELTYGTLRRRGTYDAILAVCSDRDRLDPAVRDVLRLGAHQLLATRTGSHAAVSTSVDLAKDVCGPRPSGFVNAVLRRVASRDLDAWLAIVAPDRSADEVGYLAVRYSYPRWIVEAFRDALADPAGADSAHAAPADADSAHAYGDTAHADPADFADADSAHANLEIPAETEQALAAGNARPEVVLALLPSSETELENAELASASGHGAELASASGHGAELASASGHGAELASGHGAKRTQWSPFGLRLTGGDPAPLIATGQAAAQDEASQLVAIALSRAPLDGPDKLWLDICAGPGGKARLLHHLAAGRGARLVAGEVRPHRAAQVRDALRSVTQARSAAGPGQFGAVAGGPGQLDTVAGGPGQFGAAHGAGVVIADGRHTPWRPGTFDRVLADVPCSGLGSLRRRPEARWRKTPSDLSELTDLQRQLLTSAIESVRPGGVVAYVTCSPHLAETHDVVTAVVGARSDVTILDAPAVLAEVPDLATPRDNRFAQFWPHRHTTDGMFLALIKRD